MSNWQKVRLGDVCIFQNGYAFKSADYTTKGNATLIKIKELKDGRIELFPVSTKVFYSKSLEKYVVNHDDILIALTGDPVNKNNPLSWVGRVSINKNTKLLLLNQRVAKFIPSDRLNGKFIYYYFRVFENFYNLAQKATGSASQANISTKIISETEIDLPPLEEQRRIVEVLSSLDDKIELNNRINKNLEEQASALFKRWFIDFEFPDTDGNPYKSAGGKFIDSPLGAIPDGWRVGVLNDFCTEILRGNIPRYVEYSDKPILNQKVNKGDYLDKQYYKFNDPTVIVPNNKLAAKGDVLLNSLGQGTLGRIHLYTENNGSVIIDQFITVLRTSSFSKSVYLSQLLKTAGYQSVIENNVTGSTGMWVLTINNIRKIGCVIPNDHIFSMIDKMFDSIYSKKYNNTKENQRLVQLRDSILPKLMNNEINII